MKTLRYYLLILIIIFHPLAADGVKPNLTVMIPMRDGVELPTDLYLPSSEARALPCVLVRSPAGRRFHIEEIVKLAQEGYVVAIQETRSFLDLEGKTFPFISDGWGKLQDGYDSVEWLAASPYTNGKIGTWGPSALGITQLLMAPSSPPHLTCQYIIFAAASLYHHGLFPGGQLLKNQAEGWLGYYARDSGVQSYVCQRPFYNEFWKQLNTLDVPHRVQAPAIHIGGWYDTFLQGTLSAFTSRQFDGGEGARGKQKLVIGPWTHFWPQSLHFGDFTLPQAGLQPPIDISPKKWFDYYLKGVPNQIEKIPAVTYFVMGPFDGTPSSGNEWRTSDVWPIPARMTSYHLTPDFKLKTMPASEGKASYEYHPNQVIPTSGGRNLFLESGPKDQASIEKRQDMLVFTSDQLDQDVEVTGSIMATLYFQTDQKDTDIVLRLCDVYPDGRSILISEGGCRLGVMCYEQNQGVCVQSGKVYEVKVDLWATSMVFAKGHSIRLSVSSSNYPRCEKNMNTGFIGSNTGKLAAARNTLFMGGDYPSHLQLPIVRHQPPEEAAIEKSEEPVQIL
ncbi:MAG: CocE/NonD family hydrolase [Parachlamydiaceae bacterium]